ncbi:hypothetical protein [Pyrobaculum neutrophilum]|uniref:Uncharacterized protein n=1 Tax=Pyrobaculum neutrophilum (strain DSM 2338 / JCM 9278 / NBRC 100436 / V24Sta) TaxID=444157 RepID=B1Y9P7_PYRNV|nr:hypothetical protein [Pyrobaculum neutrophilum]ACB38969.1 conserved hypothetical protein [Pyrobaculum neutrophilum V24Sta]
MFIHMVAVYGAVVLAMGAIGGEPELVALGLTMLLLGNMHRLGKALSRQRKRIIA